MALRLFRYNNVNVQHKLSFELTIAYVLFILHRHSKLQLRVDGLTMFATLLSAVPSFAQYVPTHYEAPKEGKKKAAKRNKDHLKWLLTLLFSFFLCSGLFCT